MLKETTEQALNRISRNIARMTRSDQIPRTVVEEIAPGCGWTVRTVYPPGWEHDPVENPRERPEEEADERSDGAPNNID